LFNFIFIFDLCPLKILVLFFNLIFIPLEIVVALLFSLNSDF